jgi:hypothetical protein
MRLRDAFDAVFSILVVACAAAVEFHYGRLTVFRFEGLSIPLWAVMAVCVFWPAMAVWRLVRGRAPAH